MTNKKLVSQIVDKLNLLEKIDSIKNQYESKLQLLKDFESDNSEVIEIKSVKDYEDSRNELLESISSDKKHLNELNSQKAEFTQFINEKKYELRSFTKKKSQLEKDLINIPLKCPTCGKPYDNVDEAKAHISNELENIISQIKSYESGIQECVSPVSDEEIDSTNKLIEENVKKYNEFDNKIRIYNKYQKYLNDVEVAKVKYNEVLNSTELNAEIANRSVLISEMNKYNSEISELTGMLSSINELIKSKELFDNEKKHLDDCISKIESKKEYYNNLDKYYRLFTSNGMVTSSVFSAVASEMTDDILIVRTVKELASGETRIDFDVDKKVGELVLPYSDLSGGQQTLVDIMFMNKLFKMSGHLGLLILDETLKEIDSVVIDDIVNILKEMPVTSTIISTHVEAFPYYDSKISVEMINNTSEFKVEG